MSSAAQKAWDSLNERQRIYLKLFYGIDQGLESERRMRAANGWWDSTPAKVWRRLHFNSQTGPIVPALEYAGVYDSGAGSTLKTLRERGLIESESLPGPLLDVQVFVWMTRAGRAAVRAGTNEARPPRRPRWALAEKRWKTLVAVANAGAEGLHEQRLGDDDHLYLDRDYDDQPGNRPYLYITTRLVTWTAHDSWTGKKSTASGIEGRYRLTAQGREHYIERLGDYRKLYPDVEAPDVEALGDEPPPDVA